MVTIIGMSMTMQLAKPEIQKMGGNDQYNGRYQQPCLVFGKKLF